MTKIHINIGSNQNRRNNIMRALEALKMNFFELVYSDIFESLAYGFKGANFYNMGVNAETDLRIVEVLNILHIIENNQGRDRTQPKFSARQIDLDLILYANAVDKKYNLPRDDILKYNFVLAPLVQLNPTGIHPSNHQTYQQLYAAMPALKSYNIEILNKERL